MAIRVSDILNIKSMNAAQVLSGHAGLNKVIHRIASIEKPFTDHPEYCYRMAKPGDIYVSKLYMFDGDVTKLHEEIEFQRRTKGCGLITYKEMLSFIDEKVRSMSDCYELPIIVIDKEPGLTELTFSVMDLIIKDRITQAHVSHFENLMQNNLTGSEVRNNVMSLDWNIRRYIQSVFMKTNSVVSRIMYESEESDLLLPVYGGLIYIITDDQEKHIVHRRQKFLERTKGAFEKYVTGISELNCEIENVKNAALQSLYAYVFGKNIGSSVVYYDKLGEFALFAELKGSQILKKYRDRFYREISESGEDEQNGMIKMLELFIISGGSFKAVSEQMHVHETTIRYRLNKIKNHMNYKNSNDFYTDIKTAVYSKWILEDDILHAVN